METKKVTIVLFPDEDGGYTAVMPYFSCNLTPRGGCMTAQGWTADEALSEARILIERYLAESGPDGRYYLEHAQLVSVEVTDMEVDVDVDVPD